MNKIKLYLILLYIVTCSNTSLANTEIVNADLYLQYEEIKPYEISLGSYSNDLIVLTPPEFAKLSNKELYKNIDNLTKDVTEKREYVLIYSEEDPQKIAPQKPIVIVETTVIQGEARVKTALGNGWEHRVALDTSDLVVNTGFRKHIIDAVLFKVEDRFEVKVNNDEITENKVVASISFDF